MPRESNGGLAPLRKSVRVKGSVEAAFRLFTEGLGRWWPLASHSVCQDDAVACFMEGGVGGRLFERDRAGREHVWGTITAWEPPRRLVFTWHPGRGAESAQDVELRFADAGGGMTLVELIHTGWERLGETAAETRERYDQGWAFVLGECFVKAAA
jgi:uncharacterized protein YndB with AHSA1/START domain